MAYSSHIISNTYHLDSLIYSGEQARKKFKREFKKCASSSKQFKHTVLLFVNIIDKVFIMPNVEHIADSSISFILEDNIKTPSTFNSIVLEINHNRTLQMITSVGLWWEVFWPVTH